MSLTAFNRLRRMQQIEEMKPENIKNEKVENFSKETLVPEEAKDTLVPDTQETSTRRKRKSE